MMPKIVMATMVLMKGREVAEEKTPPTLALAELKAIVSFTRLTRAAPVSERPPPNLAPLPLRVTSVRPELGML